MSEDVSTTVGARHAIQETLEEWLPGGYGVEDGPRMHVRNVVSGLNDVSFEVYDEHGMPVTRWRCALLVIEMPLGSEDAPNPDQEMPVVTEENDPVVHLGLLSDFTGHQLPVINAATAVKSWRLLESIKFSDPEKWERVWPRFLELCWNLPHSELRKLPPLLFQVMVDYWEHNASLKAQHGGG